MISWPSTLDSYAEQGSFKLVPHEPLLRTQNDQGPARVRRRFTSTPATISFSAVMSYEEFETFRAFYHSELFDGQKWFVAPIHTGAGGYIDHEVRFREAYQASDAGFDRTSVSFSLETRSVKMYDGASLYLIQEWTYDGIVSVSDPLQVIVNTKYPIVMENY